MSEILTAVDLFAGLGGNTEGAEQAGVRVIRAANHWGVAVETHRLNHPDVEHDCQDLQQANFYDWPDFDIMMASPACQGHSSARGAERAHHDATRSTAWAVVARAEAKQPKFVMVENVPDFMRWQLYPQWSNCLESLGYTLSPNVIDAADLGVPQHRRRLFIVGVHKSISTKPVVVPNPAGSTLVAANTVIDWEAGSWSKVLKPGRAMATMRRWAAGRRQYGERFLMAYFGKERGGRSLLRPMGTLTTRDRYALVREKEMRMLTASEYRSAMGFRPTYILPSQHKLAVHLLGNSVAPACARHVVEAMKAHLYN